MKKTQNVKEINFVIRDEKFLTNQSEIAHEFYLNSHDYVLMIAKDINSFVIGRLPGTEEAGHSQEGAQEASQILEYLSTLWYNCQREQKKMAKHIEQAIKIFAK